MHINRFGFFIVVMIGLCLAWPAIANTDTLFLSELMVQPDGEEQEWIELYHSGAEAIDLAGFSLHDEVGEIAAATGTVLGNSFVVFDLPKSVLNNGGDRVSLLFGTTTVDTIVYGKPISGVTSTVSAPGLGKTIARKADGTFVVAATSTKGAANIFLSDIVSSTPAATTTTTTVSSLFIAQDVWETNIPGGIVIINEFVSDPADDEVEFVELFNTSDKDIDISGWSLEDGSETKTMLQGSMFAKQFFVIEKPKGTLNNAGDEIVLYHSNGKEIDRVTFGNYDDGNLADNAPVAKDPYSVARKNTTQATQIDREKFAVTQSITKGKSNVVVAESIEQAGKDATEQVVDKKIIISEIFPNPKGADTEKEFIEIKNIGAELVDITGWKLGDSSKKRFTFSTSTVLPNNYAVFFRKDSGISLNNSGEETVRLFTNNNAVADSISYDGAGREDESFARKTNGTFAWTVSLTPEKDNEFFEKNHAPEIAVSLPETVVAGQKIVLDASDTADEENDPLRFSWFIDNGQIGEGNVYEHTFATSGKHSLVLAVADAAGNEVKKEMKLSIKRNGDLIDEIPPTNTTSLTQTVWQEKNIVISEIFPDPEGSDATEEFIELYNLGDYEVDISNWYLDDAEGGSKPYKIPDGTMIAAKQYLAFDRETTKIAINNTEDHARLLFPDKTIAEDVAMADIFSAAAYIKQEGAWVWSEEITPGEANRLIALAAEQKAKKKFSRDGKTIAHTTIADVKDLEIGDVVAVQGTVSVKPGVFGANNFYLLDKIGIQIYMNKKHLPRLTVGDVVEVVGVVGETKGERRLTVKKKEDARVIRPGTAPEVPKSEIAAVSLEDVAKLIMIEGEIMEKKANYLFIDDGTEEIQVSLAKGVKIKEAIKEGDILRVAGIVRTKGEELLLMPRGAEDVQKIGVASSTAAESMVANTEKKNEYSYLIITFIGLGALGAIFLLKKKGKL